MKFTKWAVDFLRQMPDKKKVTMADLMTEFIKGSPDCETQDYQKLISSKNVTMSALKHAASSGKDQYEYVFAKKMTNQDQSKGRQKPRTNDEFLEFQAWCIEYLTQQPCIRKIHSDETSGNRRMRTMIMTHALYSGIKE